MTTDQPDNRAAWLRAPFAPLEVGPAEMPSPGEGEVVVRNRAVAINPIDRFKQKLGNFLYGWIRYPFILGNDLAGDVVAVGPNVHGIQPGDRVVAHATGMEKQRNRPAEGAFQLHTVVLAKLTATLPEHVSYVDAAVMPLAVSTAASALFLDDQLGLARPSLRPRRRDETVLVWGGSTSVGVNAIQLAVAAGYRVVATASKHNFEYLRALGASEVLEYRASDAAQRVRSALEGHSIAGALAMGDSSAIACIEALEGASGARKVAMVSFPLRIDDLPDRPGLGTMLTRFVPQMLAGWLRIKWRAWRARVSTSTVWGTALMKTDLAAAIYRDFLPEALGSGRHVPAPKPLVVGSGLEAIERGFERQRQGVSAAKVVVALD